MKKTIVLFATSALGLALLATAPALAQGDGPKRGPALDRTAPTITASHHGRPLATGNPATPRTAVSAFLRGHGWSKSEMSTLRTTERIDGSHGMRFVHMAQKIDGLTVYGAYLKAAVNARGELVYVINGLADVSAPTASRVTPRAALDAAMSRLHPAVTVGFRQTGNHGATTIFDGGSFFHSPPMVTAVAVPMDDHSLARGWLVETWTSQTNQLHETLVSGDGKVLAVESRTANDSYLIYPEDPGKSGQQLVQGPGSTSISPVGWLGSGAQRSIAITGNNAFTYLDADANNRADKGGTSVTTGNFLSQASLTDQPSTVTNRAVSVQNLFYLNNVMHDVLYGYGFTEAAGNFQTDNFQRGGKARDAVQAEAQDGSGTNNANFATPVDGRKPRMQMYLWSSPGPTHEVVVNSPGLTRYDARPAEFGPALTSTGITGDVVAASPADGCTTITTPLTSKVALIDRGNCTFTTKVANAQAAGATAVIIANNTPGDETIIMGGSDASVNIPSVMIGNNSGNELKFLSSPNATVRAKAALPPQLDSSLDSDIVFHEYCHGLTWRMIGGMSGPLAGALGEGMSDGCAMLINGDDRIGEYVGGSPIGIRSAPYDGYTGTYGDVSGTEVHSDGEVYGAIVWRMMQLFGDTRRADLFKYVVDGMNYTPSTPAYENMRDGILAGITNSSSSEADKCLVWDAFAQFGVGVGAQGVVNANSTVSITPSNAVPAGCL